MQSSDCYYLSLEPYVHGIVRGDKVLLYNTLNKKHLIFNSNPEVAALINQLLQPSNGRVIEVPGEKLTLSPIKNLVQQLQRTFMGEVFHAGWSDIKPVNFIPLPVVKETPFTLEDNLHEITIHLDSGPEPMLKSFQDAFYQFTFPKINSAGRESIDTGMIERLIDEVSSLPLLTINLVGSHVLSYPGLGRLLTLSQAKQFRKKIHIPLNLYERGHLPLITSYTRLVFLVTFPVSSSEILKMRNIIQEIPREKDREFIFIVQDHDEVEQSEVLIGQLDLKSVYFKPFFNGHNNLFFETSVFMTETDIVSSKPSQRQILSRYMMNENDFGKITILPDGSIYSNVNEVALGSLKESSVIELIKKERNGGSSWKRIRMDQTPCSRCIYQFLCPPVSNYELFMKKFNLCHIEID
ncbi:MAG: TIGR04150 pseudo-rSAM protein [Bacteroidota bacterium]